MKNQMDRLSINSNTAHIFALAMVFGLLCFLWLFTGCSSTPKSVRAARAVSREAYELQKPIVVQTSEKDDRPQWTKNTSYEQEGKLYFSGGFLNGSDYAVSVRCANAEALKVAVQGLGEFIRAEFTEYVQGSNTGSEGVDRYVEDGIATFVESLHMQGVKQKVVYYEETFSPTLMQPTYNVWVQLEMSVADYLKCKAGALKRMRERFAREGQEEAKEKAEQLLDELKRDIEKEKEWNLATS